MKDDPRAEIQGVLTRDLTEAGMPERLALPLAEFAAASVCAAFVRQQVYFPESALVRLRDQKIREMHRRALANVTELQVLTGLRKSQVYAILSRKVR